MEEEHPERIIPLVLLSAAVTICGVVYLLLRLHG